MGYSDSLGTGQVEYTIGRQIIHFGSPDGTVYTMDAKVVKSNISVKEWLEQNG
jgi:hypothetical protein